SPYCTTLRKLNKNHKNLLWGSGTMLRPNQLKSHGSPFHCCSSNHRKGNGTRGGWELRSMGSQYEKIKDSTFDDYKNFLMQGLNSIPQDQELNPDLLKNRIQNPEILKKLRLRNFTKLIFFK
uniref:Uncharacterized protein n=1 Tax=Canis lupus dingo TaxID=286419 RepID=A0A8C0L0A5_CANLU